VSDEIGVSSGGNCDESCTGGIGDYTIVCCTAATQSGQVDRIRVWIGPSNNEAMESGVFTEDGSDNLTCPAAWVGSMNAAINALSHCETFEAGTDFTAFEIDIGEDDYYAGVFLDGPAVIRYNNSGGDGMWYNSTLDQCECSGVAFTHDTNNLVCIGGDISAAGGETAIPIMYHHYQQQSGG